MRIILVSGYAGSGKDTFSDLCVKYGYTKYAFADAVKKFTAEKHGFPYEITQTQEGKKTMIGSQSVRQLLISESLEMKIKSDDPAYWAKLLIKDLQGDKIIISDWRYTAEYDQIKVSFPDAKLTRLRIRRSSYIKIDDPSEHELDNADFDIIVQNDGPLDSQVKAICDGDFP